MFEVKDGYFFGLVNRIFEIEKENIFNQTKNKNNVHRVKISMGEVYDIVRHPNYRPNSYINLNGIYASLERSKLTRGTNTQHYIKFEWRHF